MNNRRLLVTLDDGYAVEAVYYSTGTLCVSAQVGCAIGCPFCASGSRGLLRNLTSAEIMRQVVVARTTGCEPRRITISGIGEPLQNLAAVAGFMDACNTAGLAVSVTTCGAPLARLRDLLRLPHNGVMLSLHAAEHAIRTKLVPAAAHPFALQELLLAEWPALSRRRRRKLGINYLLFAGVNDGDAELDALKDWLRPFPELTVHLLAYNPVPQLNGSLLASSRMEHWYEALLTARVHVRRANRWRRQSDGGCGTLFVRDGLPVAE